MSDATSRTAPAPLAAVVGWLLPGAGYWLIGQRARALTTGITIIALFILGLLIGGIRLIEVPGYGDHGGKLVVPPAGGHVVEQRPGDTDDGSWILTTEPTAEVRNKPWYIPQILAGPMTLVASAGSVIASRPLPDGSTPGARSHSRTNELGVLYTAVAGMLNLLAIIDSAYRAAHARGEGA